MLVLPKDFFFWNRPRSHEAQISRICSIRCDFKTRTIVRFDFGVHRSASSEMARISKNKVDEDIRYAFMSYLAAGGLQPDRAETSIEQSTFKIGPPMLVTTSFNNVESIVNISGLRMKQRSALYFHCSVYHRDPACY